MVNLIPSKSAITCALTLFFSFAPISHGATSGACPPKASTATSLPTKFGVLLFPGFEILDVAGPLSALNLIVRGPTPKPGSELITISHKPGLVSTNTSVPFYETFVATHSIYSSKAKELDVLLVPGGPGTRTLDPEYVEYIRNVYPCLQYLLVVCTGAGTVAKTGILDGRKATGNKAAWQWIIAQGPNVDWVRQARWVVDGNIWTTSGVAAGIDGTLAWIREVYGEDQAVWTANMMEYERHANASWDPFSDIWNNTKRNRNSWILKGYACMICRNLGFFVLFL
ncbi:class I glutamine amidotransferase-like protein [Kalaharituber pfeilii]|nr:class I glutamine amidotransferase-like protein [Kalaharituber pfeilii]